MTAPSPTARQTPTGLKLADGYQSLITFATDTDIEFWEKQVTPPGVDGGDGIDQTTMHNSTYRTMLPQSLKSITEVQVTCAYDPIMYTRAISLVNVNTTITITWTDGTTLAFFGFMKSFQPSAMSQGGQPEATITIVPTNVDPASGAEEAPVLTNVAGT